MKRVVSIILVSLLIIGMCQTAFAAQEVNLTTRSQVPVVYISGDSTELSYDNGTKTFKINKMLKIFGDSEEGSISQAAFNILYPMLMKGVINDDWGDYYDALYKEISEVYAPIMLDENGEPNTDCDISQWEKDDIERAMVENRKANDGTYGEKNYRFYYDWRLDPVFLADQLNDYIEGVKKITNHEQVNVSVRCLGCNVLLAYIAKYGTDSLKGVGVDVATSMGAEFLSGMLSGDFGIDGNAIARLAKDFIATGDLEASDPIWFAIATVELLSNTGVLGKMTDEVKANLYAKIEYGVISALARSTFMTFPGYWGMVTYEDFDTALLYVFGEEGSEKREQYKGLIEKITYFNENIKKDVLPIMGTLGENGVNVCIISKYGVQMVPVLENGDILSDEYVSVNHSSLGATTSTVYTTLSDEYIAERTQQGFGKYISPDKQIDASTCLYPDSTWFVKGLRHGRYVDTEVALMMTVMDYDRQLTVDDFYLTQFTVFDNDTRVISPMTEENCNDPYWEADEKTDHPETKSERLTSFLKTLFVWLKAALNLIKGLLAKSDAPETVSIIT